MCKLEFGLCTVCTAPLSVVTDQCVFVCLVLRRSYLLSHVASGRLVFVCGSRMSACLYVRSVWWDICAVNFLSLIPGKWSVASVRISWNSESCPLECWWDPSWIQRRCPQLRPGTGPLTTAADAHTHRHWVGQMITMSSTRHSWEILFCYLQKKNTVEETSKTSLKKSKR